MFLMVFVLMLLKNIETPENKLLIITVSSVPTVIATHLGIVVILTLSEVRYTAALSTTPLGIIATLISSRLVVHPTPLGIIATLTP